MWFMAGFLFGALFMFLLLGIHIIWKDDKEARRGNTTGTPWNR